MNITKIFRTQEISQKGKIYQRRHGIWYCTVKRTPENDIFCSEILFGWDSEDDGGIPEMDCNSYAVTHGGSLFREMQANFPTQEEMIEKFLEMEEKKVEGKEK